MNERGFVVTIQSAGGTTHTWCGTATGDVSALNRAITHAKSLYPDADGWRPIALEDWE